jgi:hypothetical protein
MKEVFLGKVNEVLEALAANSDQSIEVRGALAFGEQFRNALHVIAEDAIDQEEVEVPAPAEETPEVPLAPKVQVEKTITK